MLTISLPTPRFDEVGFQPEAEYRRTLAPGTAPPLLERISFAQPVVVPLRADQAQSDPRIAAWFAERATQWKFSLVNLTLSFAPAPDEPITLAVVEVSLTSAGPTASFVLDMEPDKIADTPDLKRALEGGVTLDVSGNKLGFTLKHSSERPESELFLVAGGIGSARAGWELTETPGMKIGGKMVLNLIVQTPAGSPATGRVATTLQVRRKRFGLIPYRALLDDHPSGRFVCEA